jgi:hypothetical protein
VTLESRVIALAQRIAGTVGKEIDWAARLNNGLVAPTSAGLASESAGGVTQLAADADVIAGVLTKPMSPGRAPIRAFTSFAAMGAAYASMRSGTICVLPDIATTNGVVASVWQVRTGGIFPLIAITATTAAALNDLVTIVAGITNLALIAGHTEARVPNGTRYDTYRYIGATTKFLLWEGRVPITFASGVGTRDGNANYINEAWADGDQMRLDLMVSGPTAGPGLLASISGTNNAPPIDTFLSGAYIDTATVGTSTQWRAMNVYVSADAGVRVLTGGIAQNWAIGVTGRFKRKVPSA